MSESGQEYGESFDWEDGNREGACAGKWYAVPGCGEDTSPTAWTISPDQKLPGWSTDCGVSGYGLPREVAEALAERLNRTAKATE